MERLFDTDSLEKRTSIFDVDNDKVLVITDKSGRFDRQYLLPITSFSGGAFIPITEKGQSNGVVPLDSNGLIPISFLPSLSSSEINDSIITSVTTWSSFKIAQELALKGETIHALNHIIGGSDVIDGDNIHITYIPTNYIRDNINTEGLTLEALVAHLKGIDTKLINAGQKFEEVRVITGLEEATKSLNLTFTVNSPTRTEIFPKNGIRQFYGDDFIVSLNTISWSGLGLDGVLVAGDKIYITYQ